MSIIERFTRGPTDTTEVEQPAVPAIPRVEPYPEPERRVVVETVGEAVRPKTPAKPHADAVKDVQSASADMNDTLKKLDAVMACAVEFKREVDAGESHVFSIGDNSATAVPISAEFGRALKVKELEGLAKTIREREQRLQEMIYEEIRALQVEGDGPTGRAIT